MALSFNHKAKQTVIDAVAAISKSQDRKLVEPEIKRLPSDVSEQIVANAWPPDFVMYRPGQKKVFVLKAGQESDHFIRAQGVSNITFQIRYGKYSIITRSGKVYKQGSIPSHVPEDFRIHVTTDTDMRLVFE